MLAEACTTTHRFYLPTIPTTWKAPLFHQNKPRSCSTRVPCSPDNINDEIRADDVAETTNHFNAFNWVLDHVDDPVNKSLVCSLHGILKRGTSQEFDANRNVGGYKMIETYAPNRIRYSYVDQWNQAGYPIDTSIIIQHLTSRNRQNQPQYAERYQWAKHATFCPQPQPKRKSTNCRQSS